MSLVLLVGYQTGVVPLNPLYHSDAWVRLGCSLRKSGSLRQLYPHQLDHSGGTLTPCKLTIGGCVRLLSFWGSPFQPLLFWGSCFEQVLSSMLGTTYSCSTSQNLSMYILLVPQFRVPWDVDPYGLGDLGLSKRPGKGPKKGSTSKQKLCHAMIESSPKSWLPVVQFRL